MMRFGNDKSGMVIMSVEEYNKMMDLTRWLSSTLFAVLESENDDVMFAKDNDLLSKRMKQNVEWGKAQHETIKRRFKSELDEYI